MLSGKTNGEVFHALSQEEKKVFLEEYKNHPLVDYIDWKAFYDGDDGNALHFVRYLSQYTNEDGNQVFVLKKIIENEEDYLLVFVCGENAFYKIPDASLMAFANER